MTFGSHANHWKDSGNMKLVITAAFMLAASSAVASIEPSDLDSFTQKDADWACSLVFISGLNSLKSDLVDMSAGGITVNSMSAKDYSQSKATCTVDYTFDKGQKNSQKSFLLTGPLENLNSIKGLNSGHRYDVIWMDDIK